MFLEEILKILLFTLFCLKFNVLMQLLKNFECHLSFYYRSTCQTIVEFGHLKLGSENCLLQAKVDHKLTEQRLTLTAKIQVQPSKQSYFYRTNAIPIDPFRLFRFYCTVNVAVPSWNGPTFWIFSYYVLTNEVVRVRQKTKALTPPHSVFEQEKESSRINRLSSRTLKVWILNGSYIDLYGSMKIICHTKAFYIFSNKS